MYGKRIIYNYMLEAVMKRFNRSTNAAQYNLLKLCLSDSEVSI